MNEILNILRSPTPTELHRIVELDGMFSNMSKSLGIPKSRLWAAAIGLDKNNTNMHYSYTYCRKCKCELYVQAGNDQSCARCGEPSNVKFFGRVYTVEAFNDALNLLDRDGYGRAYDEDFIRRNVLMPSDLGKVSLRGVKYIVWFSGNEI